MRIATLTALALATVLPAIAGDLAPSPATLDALGERLFFDTNLSANRTQACSTCHSPDHAFADPRGAGSMGDDGASFGDRNAPTVTYASMIPRLHQNGEGQWMGGAFWDGRAARLEDQAGGPPLNPIEMGMPDKAAVVARLAEDPVYQEAFATLFAPGVLDDTDAAYDAMTAALAAFERRPEFAPFDSKYDRYLRGEVELTKQEDLGRLLFFSQQFTNCNVCHQLSRSPIDPAETFTNNLYFNIGVPENSDLRSYNGVAPGTLDKGLGGNDHVADPGQLGKFRVPTLRNVAVTGPYMHNGVFEDLRTVILFYNKYNARAEARQINPETGEKFGDPQYPETLALTELETGPALTDQRIDALVAFLKTLTDARYEPLLSE